MDFIITDSPGYFTATGTLSPPANCDHNIVFAQLNIQSPKPKAFKRMVRNFKHVNVNGLNAALIDADWASVFLPSTVSIDSVYDNWLDLFNFVLNKYILCREVTIRPRDKPWMNGSIRRGIRVRDRLLSLFSQSKSALVWERYRLQRNSVVNLIRKAKKVYNGKLNSLLANPSTSAKKWWSITKSLLGNKVCSSIPDLNDNGHLVSKSREKAEVFNEHFISQSTLPSGNSSFVLPLLRSPFSLDSICASEFQI